MFASYEKNEDPQRAITFGDGNQGLVKGLRKIAIPPDHSIYNVFLVDSLDYNLLSVFQLCKMGYNCLFTDVGVTVFRRSDDSCNTHFVKIKPKSKDYIPSHIRVSSLCSISCGHLT
jgi:hypothetical protein